MVNPIQLHPVVVASPVAAPIDLVPLGSIFEARMLRPRPKMVDFHPCPRLQEAHWKRGDYPRRRAAVVEQREAEHPRRRAAVVVERETERPRRRAAVVPNCRLVPPLQVDSMFLAPLAVPDAANPACLHLQHYRL